MIDCNYKRCNFNEKRSFIFLLLLRTNMEYTIKDICLFCDALKLNGIKLDCEHEFCFQCLLPWFRSSLMKKALVCPRCDAAVVHMTIDRRILTPVEGRLLALAYSIIYPDPLAEPPTLYEMKMGIDGMIAAADWMAITSNEEGKAWLKDEMGMDSVVEMQKHLKEYIIDNYAWLYRFNYCTYDY